MYGKCIIVFSCGCGYSKMSSLIYLDEPDCSPLRNQRFSYYRFKIRKSMVPYEYRPDKNRHIIAKNNVLGGEKGK